MTNHTSLYANIAVSTLLVPLIRTSDTVPADGQGLDLQNCDDAALIFVIGANGDTYSGTDKLELEVQEADTDVDASYSAVANADLTNYVTGTNVGTVKAIIANTDCSQSYYVGYRGSKRFIRGKLNFSGTHSTGTSTAILGLRGRNRAQPANAYT
ncbi:hypothetical protein [Zavarzinella formosa]|uniref:hypothetical protein n=1 Tax=Zavarzinella formosa TaxID=360055 RepID=UPI0002D67540|nr:hypothetical protein [Zavarzinella formosa]